MIIVHIYQTYNIMRLITNLKCTFPTKDDEGYLEQASKWQYDVNIIIYTVYYKNIKHK